MPDEKAPPVLPLPNPPEDGFDAFMSRTFGRSWRTSLAGLLSMACGVVAGISAVQPGVIPPILLTVATVVGPIVGGGGLMVAKDSKVTGLPAPRP